MTNQLNNLNQESPQLKGSTCDIMLTLLQDLLDGSIDPLDKIIAEEHLKTCRKCHAELTELKLLFWDLNDKNNYDINLPPELDMLKESLLADYTESIPAKKTSGIIMDFNRRNARAASMFLDYVPGVKTGNKLLKKSVDAAPAALGKVSRALVKTTKFLLAE